MAKIEGKNFYRGFFPDPLTGNETKATFLQFLDYVNQRNVVLLGGAQLLPPEAEGREQILESARDLREITHALQKILMRDAKRVGELSAQSSTEFARKVRKLEQEIS